MKPSCLLIALWLWCSSACNAKSTVDIENSYIAVFNEGVDPLSKSEELCKGSILFKGVKRFHVYQHALKGFSFKASDSPIIKKLQLARLKMSPAVKYIVDDLPAWVQQQPNFVPLQPGQFLNPSNIRIGAATSKKEVRPKSNIAVAILDTGIQSDHPDLDSVISGTNCIDPGQSTEDDNGHGTGTAGIIGAVNKADIGVVGVAPSTAMYAVKVLDSRGVGSTATVICGLDWVLANRNPDGGPPIKVVNLSLGGPSGANRSPDPCPADCNCESPWHEAVCRLTKGAGITVVASAGNEAQSIARNWLAALPEAFTVTAMTDTDGRGGQKGPSPCIRGERDDRAASFSNFAVREAEKKHVIAAPGVCITTTFSDSQYTIFSGTSESAPYVSAVVALCYDTDSLSGPCSSMTPTQVIDYLRTQAKRRREAVPSSKFKGDPKDPIRDKYYGFLLWGGRKY